MMELLRLLESNSANPKNIQIPFELFRVMREFANKIDPSSLTDEEKTAYTFMQQEIQKKTANIRNRQEYKAVIQAGKNEETRQSALKNYLNTKQLGKLGL